ncbi:MAG: ABC transporter permease [Thermodesulfobacteriota bacterium]
MDFLSLTVASILAAGTPLALASLGETFTERAGVINLSMDGAILLSAFSAFAVASLSGNPWAGLLIAAATGMATALVLAAVGLVLGRSQLAVGFTLTLLCRDLAYFLGQPYARQPGPQFDVWNIPGLSQLPLIGPVLGSQTPVAYLALILIALSWWWLYRTQAGIKLRAVGESPGAAFGRGLNVMRYRIGYTLLGGSLVGVAGAAFSLAVKPGWGCPQGAEGSGWIALAIVIFGGWDPWRVAFGAYFFSALQVLGIHLQDSLPGVPAQVFQTAPFPMMILTLLAVNLGRFAWIRDSAERHSTIKKVLDYLDMRPPAALGKDFDPRDTF